MTQVEEKYWQKRRPELDWNDDASIAVLTKQER